MIFTYETKFSGYRVTLEAKMLYTCILPYDLASINMDLGPLSHFRFQFSLNRTLRDLPTEPYFTLEYFT